MSDDKYNGWTNYETWCCNLWIDNDEYGQDRMAEMAKECRETAIENHKPGPITPDEEAAMKLSDMVKDWVTETPDDGGMIPDLGSTFAGDLLNAAVSEINFDEIAKAAIDNLDD